MTVDCHSTDEIQGIPNTGGLTVSVLFVEHIYKSGDINKLDCYRPISVLPVLSKFQFKYRSNRSTSTAVTLFVDNIRKEVDNGKLTGAVFIDLTKAFDTISHAVLLQRLQSYGVRDNELSWFTVNFGAIVIRNIFQRSA
ncbi:uncharacterized protein LOC130657830 [Hydractinia symbiolongicarpus]|uniref:uncharacterized protein LOC130657830 n=1 Tax=Hydractinia symbiolongicarpus TaxID=13093 RepID=UPI00254E3DCE|nr:uncharacterized protein LOC130657830 [Hydractinia symbiolongicarpus]